MGDFVKFDFTEKDILDSFDIFMEYGKHIKKYYYLDEIIDEFLYYMAEDIIETYGKENLYKCKKFLRNKLNNNEEYLYNKYGEDENN